MILTRLLISGIVIFALCACGGAGYLASGSGGSNDVVYTGKQTLTYSGQGVNPVTKVGGLSVKIEGSSKVTVNNGTSQGTAFVQKGGGFEVFISEFITTAGVGCNWLFTYSGSRSGKTYSGPVSGSGAFCENGATKASGNFTATTGD